jgi:hypothetical protein
MKKLFFSAVSSFFLIVTIFLYGCQIKPTQPPLQDSFDTNPATMILYFDIHYPGFPMPTKINGIPRCIPYPVFRVWGDSFALLNMDSSLIQREQIYTGFLSAGTRAALYNLLIKEKFFSLPEKLGVNPAGSSISMGVKLKDQPVFYRSGGTDFIAYSRFVDLIKPEVTPISEQTGPDARVDAFFKQYSNCPTYEN